MEYNSNESSRESAVHNSQNEEEVNDVESTLLSPQHLSSGQPKKYFLEVALLILFFGNNLSLTLVTNQMIKQTCLQMDYNQTICDMINQELNSTKEIEKEIQPKVAKIKMVIDLVHTILPAILSLFLGPFSDIYGRKSILNSTFSGYALTMISFTCVCFYSEYVSPLSPWSYFFCYMPATLLGGWPSLLSATLCSITDTCKESDRPFRLTVIELIIFLGVLLGNLSCSAILSMTNTATVFAVSSICATFATLIIILLFDESVNAPREATLCEKAGRLFSPIYLYEIVKTCFKRRSFNERRILLCLITILMLTVFTFAGNSTVTYLFERMKFNWTIIDHNYYDSANIVLTVIGMAVGFTLFRKTLHFSDMSITCLALISGLVDSLLKGFATQPWHMYAISSITLFRILSSPMLRSQIAAIVPHDEIGKVFSITTSFEALSDLIASPLYTYVYNSTLFIFPGTFFFITVGVYLFNVALALYTFIIQRVRESLINPYSIIEEN